MNCNKCHLSAGATLRNRVAGVPELLLEVCDPDSDVPAVPTSAARILHDHLLQVTYEDTGANFITDCFNSSNMCVKIVIL
ncbi:unnamed protein product [Callosobruchus maculatus]|uniref:Uncharacterized protein n=1 Tax=Callosobruchus maculatus TaxID=64391 RepID=A0A653C5E4_CALMS|nr:unnamed protein product [Callosobruchus maculatus]